MDVFLVFILTGRLFGDLSTYLVCPEVEIIEGDNKVGIIRITGNIGVKGAQPGALSIRPVHWCLKGEGELGDLSLPFLRHPRMLAYNTHPPSNFPFQCPPQCPQDKPLSNFWVYSWAVQP